jgi:hypothetical protein
MAIIDAWGSSGSNPSGNPRDLNDDDRVDSVDLRMVLQRMGYSGYSPSIKKAQQKNKKLANQIIKRDIKPFYRKLPKNDRNRIRSYLTQALQSAP